MLKHDSKVMSVEQLEEYIRLLEEKVVELSGEDFSQIELWYVREIAVKNVKIKKQQQVIDKLKP